MQRIGRPEFPEILGGTILFPTLPQGARDQGVIWFSSIGKGLHG